MALFTSKAKKKDAGAHVARRKHVVADIHVVEGHVVEGHVALDPIFTNFGQAWPIEGLAQH